MTPELCRRLWRLRLENIALRDDIDPEDDYRAFAKYFMDGTIAITLWSRPDVLEGFVGWNVKALSFDGQEYERVVAEYAFINPRYRGQPEFKMACVLAALRTVLRAPSKPRFLMGVAYPSSFITVKVMFRRVSTLRSPNISRFERKILEAFTREECGESEGVGKGIVRMRTVPKVPERKSRRPEVQAAFAEYESLNPNWKEGHGLPTVVTLDNPSILNVARHAFGLLFRSRPWRS
jgi:hypothetical protein